MALMREFLFQLISEPVNTRALASMSSVAGQALTHHLSDILPALLRCISQATDEQQQSDVRRNHNLENFFYIFKRSGLPCNWLLPSYRSVMCLLVSSFVFCSWITEGYVRPNVSCFRFFRTWRILGH